MSNKLNRTGEERKTAQGYTLRIVEYENCHKMTVEVLETGQQIHTSYWKYANGHVTPNLEKYPVKVLMVDESEAISLPTTEPQQETIESPQQEDDEEIPARVVAYGCVGMVIFAALLIILLIATLTGK
jgi:hypothetical protein